MFDAHNHLHFAAFDDDRDEVIDRAVRAGVRGMVLAGYDASRRELALELARRPGIAATAGLHPWAVADADVDVELATLEALDWDPFCAVGELGLDWVRATTEAERQLQIDVFRRQLAIARNVNKPLVLHCVRANDELATWLKRDGIPARGGIAHSFWGSKEQARRFVDLGLHLSIGTQLTRTPSKKLDAALRAVGLDRLTVETDAPSRPGAGADSERNEPAYLPCVVDAVALVLGTTAEAVAAATERTARQLFDLREDLALSELQR